MSGAGQVAQMTEARRQYRQAEFEAIGTEYHEFAPKLKIIKPNGETKWLDITEQELAQIKAILTGEAA